MLMYQNLTCLLVFSAGFTLKTILDQFQVNSIENNNQYRVEGVDKSSDVFRWWEHIDWYYRIIRDWALKKYPWVN